MIDFSLYQGKKVLETGHTGFKGSYLCEVLLKYGAGLTGYALKPPTEPSLFELSGLQKRMNSVQGDIRDLVHLRRVFEETQPEIVIHMAAQPLVRRGIWWQVGDGKMIKVWKDKWIPSPSTYKVITPERTPEQIQWVSDLIDEDSKEWKRALVC